MKTYLFQWLVNTKKGNRYGFLSVKANNIMQAIELAEEKGYSSFRYYGD